MNGMTYSKAWNMWERATIIYSKEIYEIMCYMIKVQRVVIVIDRNPTINYGSQIAVRVVDIIPDMNNHTLSLPISILVDMNADLTYTGSGMGRLMYKLTSLNCGDTLTR